MEEITCPVCHGGALSRGQGRLDQSGDTFLATVVWSCARCGYARYQPAVHARWRPAEGVHPELPPAAPAEDLPAAPAGRGSRRAA